MAIFSRSVLTAVALCALGTSLAQVQPRDQRQEQRYDQRQDQRQHQRQEQRHDQRQDPRYDQRRHPQPPPGYRAGGPDYRPGHGPGFQGQRGAGPNHNWYRGARVPATYRTHHYVVNDWRGHRLSAPPRGYQWVQNGPDYLLVAIATGVIAQLILGH